MREVKGTHQSEIFTFGGRVHRGPTGLFFSYLGHSLVVPASGDYQIVADHAGSINTLPGERGVTLRAVPVGETVGEGGYDHRHGGERILETVRVV